MSPRLNVERVLFSVLVLFVARSVHGTEDDTDASIWNNLADITQNLPQLSREEFAKLLNEAKDEVPVVEEYLKDETSNLFDVLKFPKLSQKHRQFAVNPAYGSYYDPSLKKIEDANELKGSKKEVSNDEVAIDPFESADESKKHPDYKKASVAALGGEPVMMRSSYDEDRLEDIYFTTIVAVSAALIAFGIVGAGVCYHRYQKNTKAAEDVEYPAYGVTGPGKETSPTSGADRKLAQNAQMYHYQHQKQQMIAFDTHQGASVRGTNGLASDDESDDGEEGDYTVYECPGLASTGEMEVRNPMFEDDPTPKAVTAPVSAAKK